MRPLAAACGRRHPRPRHSRHSRALAARAHRLEGWAELGGWELVALGGPVGALVGSGQQSWSAGSVGTDQKEVGQLRTTGGGGWFGGLGAFIIHYTDASRYKKKFYIIYIIYILGFYRLSKGRTNTTNELPTKPRYTCRPPSPPNIQTPTPPSPFFISKSPNLSPPLSLSLSSHRRNNPGGGDHQEGR